MTAKTGKSGKWKTDMIVEFRPITDGNNRVSEWIATNNHDGATVATIRENDRQPGIWWWFGMGENTYANPTTLDVCKSQVRMKANNR